MKSWNVLGKWQAGQMKKLGINSVTELFSGLICWLVGWPETRHWYTHPVP